MLRQIFSYRLIAIVIAFFIFINSAVFTIAGIILSIKGITLILKGELMTESKPGVYILESVDLFLLALVFLLFAIGIVKLFVPDAHQSIKVRNLHWLQIDTFTDLKMLLWEAVLVTLVVFFITTFVHEQENISWTLIVLPVSILLLAIGYYIMRKAESIHHKHAKNNDHQPPVE